jgi:hypothetical protein
VKEGIVKRENLATLRGEEKLGEFRLVSMKN